MFEIAADIDFTFDSAPMRRRREAISHHPERVGIDFVNVEEYDGDYKFFLYFIPASPERPGKKAVPEIGLSNIFISDKEKVASDGIRIFDITPGKWERRIDSIIDRAFAFDGRAKIDAGDKIELSDQSFSVEFWAKRGSKGKKEIVICQGIPGKPPCMSAGFGENDRFFFAVCDSILEADPVCDDENWRHWACVYDDPPKKQTIYRDGEKVGETFLKKGFEGRGNLYIGAGSESAMLFNPLTDEPSSDIPLWNRSRTPFSGHGQYVPEDFCFEGEIADIRIWNRVKGASEINEWMFNRISGEKDFLVAYWPALLASGNAIKDQSGNGHDGKIAGQINIYQKESAFVPSGYTPRRSENRVDLYRDGDVLTLSIRKEKSVSGKEVSRHWVKLVDVPGLDGFFSDAAFSLDTESEFDPGPKPGSVASAGKTPEIDYLAKDFKSFRKLMTDRLSVLSPEWKERGVADFGSAITDICACSADYMSYFQDAVATEAYLGTARSRISVARHARLLDYFMHEGCNARVLLHIGVENETDLDMGALLATRSKNLPPSIPLDHPIEELVLDGCEFFETMHPVRLYREHNEILFYTWGKNVTTIEAGSTRATLSGAFQHLSKGDILIFEETKGRETGFKEDADPGRRHPVRIVKTKISTDPVAEGQANGGDITQIEWAASDALPFFLDIMKSVDGDDIPDISVARGNIVLADHGRSVRDKKLEKGAAAFGKRPELERANLTCASLYDHAAFEKISAADTLSQDPRAALPAIHLIDEENNEIWRARTNFFNSDRFTKGFVVEVENDRSVFLRFGDGRQGKLPGENTGFLVECRGGNGVAGNVGRDSVAHVITDREGITCVRNPLSAVGGAEPEDMELARLYAASASGSQERCVTIGDYVEKMESHPDVQRAAADIRWTGSWHTVFIAVDRLGGLPDSDFCQRMRVFMERFRITGIDLRVAPPRFAPLDIEMAIKPEPDYSFEALEKVLSQKFSNSVMANGVLGYFHPDNFTFGQSVYKSRLLTEAKKIPGVKEIGFSKFKRGGAGESFETEQGKISIAPLEIARLDNNIESPGNGMIAFVRF